MEKEGKRERCRGMAAWELDLLLLVLNMEEEDFESKNTGGFLKQKKGKGTESLLESPEKYSTTDTLILVQWDPFGILTFWIMR